VDERELPLFPLHLVLFPGMRLPLHVFEERYKLMIGTCMVTDRIFGVILIQSGQEVGGPAEVFSIGTTARIVQLERLPEGRMNLVAVGMERFRLLEQIEGQPYAVGRVRLLTEPMHNAPAGLTERAGQRFRRYLVSLGVPKEQADGLTLPDEPRALSYLIASALKTPARLRQGLLEAEQTEQRLRRELALMELEAGGPSEPSARQFSLN
jgi:Lon protease-like protein